VKAAVLQELGVLKIEEKAVPEVGPEEVLIKVDLCGICGTDFLVYDGRFPVELPYYNLGHEYVGRVEKTGEKVNGVAVGDRVVINPNYHCDYCWFCRRGELEFCENRRVFKTKSNGGLAEYVAIAEKLVCKVPENVSDKEAIFAEPLSCCLHAVERIDLGTGGDVLIFGCGTMGLLTLQLCRLKGAGKIIVSEPVRARRDIAEKLGADITVNPLEEDLDKVVSEIMPRGPAIVIECAGVKDTISKGLELIGKKGQFLLLAIWDKSAQVNLNPAFIVDKEVKIAGAVFGSLTLGRAIGLLAAKKVDVLPLLTDAYPLDNINDAMKKAMSREAIKVAVTP